MHAKRYHLLGACRACSALLHCISNAVKSIVWRKECAGLPFATQDFKSGNSPIMMATDVAARGLGTQPAFLAC